MAWSTSLFKGSGHKCQMAALIFTIVPFGTINALVSSGTGVPAEAGATCIIMSSSSATIPSQVVVCYSAALMMRSSLCTAIGENPMDPIQLPEIRSG